MHECMCYMFFFFLNNNNLTNNLYFYNNFFFFNFKCIHIFAWSYMLVPLKPNTKLTNHEHIHSSPQCLHKFLSPRPCNWTQIVHQIYNPKTWKSVSNLKSH